MALTTTHELLCFNREVVFRVKDTAGTVLEETRFLRAGLLANYDYKKETVTLVGLAEKNKNIVQQSEVLYPHMNIANCSEFSGNTLTLIENCEEITPSTEFLTLVHCVASCLDSCCGFDQPESNDDTFVAAINQVINENIAVNDILCTDAVTTFSLVNGSNYGGSVTSFDTLTGAFEFTPTTDHLGNAGFIYNIHCGGILIDAAAVTILYPDAVADAVPDIENGLFNIPFVGDVSGNDSPCTLGAATTYELQIGSEVGGSITAFNNATGIYTFTPTDSYVGTAEFEYGIYCDGILADVASVNIIYPAPTADAVDDDATGVFDTAFTGSVSLNDTTCDAGLTTYIAVSGSLVGGVVDLNANTGAYTFTPNASFNGTASFQYEIYCDNYLADSATVEIIYNAPTAEAVDDTYNTIQNVAIAGNISDNDSACTAGTTTYQIVSGSTSNGVVTAFNSTTGEFTFTPDTDFNGVAMFSYNLVCNGLITDTALVSITVDAIAADAVNDAFVTPFGTVLNDTVAGNDIACTVGVTSYSLVSGSVSGGTLNILNPDGTFTFTPNSGFVGNAFFQYNIECNLVVVDTATVTISVEAPITDAVDDVENVFQDDVLVADVSVNDTTCNAGVTTYALIVGSEINGTIDTFNPVNGVYQFTPTASFIGVASFQYEIYCDGVLADAATVTINVAAVTADAVDDINTTDMSTQVSGSVIANDVVCNTGATTYQLIPLSATNGVVDAFDTAGNYMFTPTTGFIGTASFQYEILCDGVSKDTATVTITVESPTATAVNDNNSTLVDIPVNGLISGNDTACSVGITTHQVTPSSEVNGTVTSFDTNTGAYTFTPASGFTGVASFQYDILCDGNVIDTATVTINVSPFSADAVDDPETVEMSNIFNGDVSTNDTTCSGGATTTYAMVPASEVNGSLNFFNTNGTYQFVPTVGFIGAASFQYRILCNGIETDVATVLVTVTSPTADAVADSNSTLSNVQVNGDVSTNDTACSSGVTTYALVAGSEVNGTVDSFATSTGIYMFTPDTNFSGTASFDYQIVCDGNVIDTATVSIEVVTANAVDDSFNTAFATPLNQTVVGNDTVCNFGLTTYQLVAGSESSGSVTAFDTAGNFTYAPGTGDTGAQTFDYDILCDGIVVDTATVTINIANPSADAVDDAFNTINGVDLIDSVPTNDTVCATGTTTYQLVGGSTSMGTVTAFDSAGNFSYETAGVGIATFDYNILCDGIVADTATVTITIDPVSADAVNDNESVAMSTQLTGVDVATNDTVCNAGTTTYTSVGASVMNGTLDSFDSNTGAYTFTPTTGFIGVASFQYEIRCDGVVIDTAIVTITVNAPTATAVNDSEIGEEDMAFNGDVSTNDTACSSGTTTYSYVNSSATNGTMTNFNSNGTYTFTPTPSFVGNGTFQYNIECDGNIIDTATVTIDFQEVILPTVAVSWSDTVKQDPDSTEMTITGTKDGSAALNSSDTVNLDISHVVAGTPTTASISGLYGATISAGDISSVSSGTGIVIDPSSTYNSITYAHPAHPGISPIDADALYATNNEDRRVRISATITSGGNTSVADEDESYFIFYSWDNGESTGSSGETDGIAATLAGVFETNGGGGFAVGNSTNYINNYLEHPSDPTGGGGPFNHNLLYTFVHPNTSMQMDVDGSTQNFFGCDGVGSSAFECVINAAEAASATSNGAITITTNCDGTGSADIDTADNCPDHILYNMPLTTVFAPGGGALGGDWGGYLAIAYTQADLGNIYFTPDLSATSATGDPVRMIPRKFMR